MVLVTSHVTIDVTRFLTRHVTYLVTRPNDVTLLSNFSWSRGTPLYVMSSITSHITLLLVTKLLVMLDVANDVIVARL